MDQETHIIACGMYHSPYQYSNNTYIVRPDNYKTLTPHAGLYNRHLPIISILTDSPAEPKTKAVEPLVNYRFEFQDMNELIDDNRYYFLIDHQMKLDQKPGGRQQANVIIRKQQKKAALVEFLHAACFAPTKATF